MIKTIRPDEFHFHVAIEFPSSPGGIIAARNIRIWRTDVTPEIEITSCESLALHMDAEGVVWAEMRMWAYPEGGPIFDGKPIINNNTIVMYTFNVHVSSILAKASYNKGYTEGYAKLHGKPLTAAMKMRGRKMVEA